MSEPRKITLWFRQHKVHRWFRVWHWAGDDLDCRCGHGWELHDAEAIPPLCMVCGDMVRCHARSAAGAETGGLAERERLRVAVMNDPSVDPNVWPTRDEQNAARVTLASMLALLAQPAPSERNADEPERAVDGCTHGAWDYDHKTCGRHNEPAPSESSDPTVQHAAERTWPELPPWNADCTCAVRHDNVTAWLVDIDGDCPVHAAEEGGERAEWSDVLQSPADVWEIGRNAGLLDALREHGPAGDKGRRLAWLVMTPRTDENPYAEAGDRIALIAELDALLNDCDQRADSPEDPNLVKVWAVRQVIERYGGEPHRWPYPTALSPSDAAPSTTEPGDER